MENPRLFDSSKIIRLTKLYYGNASLALPVRRAGMFRFNFFRTISLLAAPVLFIHFYISTFMILTFLLNFCTDEGTMSYAVFFSRLSYF